MGTLVTKKGVKRLERQVNARFKTICKEYNEVYKLVDLAKSGEYDFSTLPLVFRARVRLDMKHKLAFVDFFNDNLDVLIEGFKEKVEGYESEFSDVKDSLPTYATLKRYKANTVFYNYLLGMKEEVETLINDYKVLESIVVATFSEEEEKAYIAVEKDRNEPMENIKKYMD